MSLHPPRSAITTSYGNRLGVIETGLWQKLLCDAFKLSSAKGGAVAVRSTRGCYHFYGDGPYRNQPWKVLRPLGHSSRERSLFRLAHLGKTPYNLRRYSILYNQSLTSDTDQRLPTNTARDRRVCPEFLERKSTRLHFFTHAYIS